MADDTKQDDDNQPDEQPRTFLGKRVVMKPLKETEGDWYCLPVDTPDERKDDGDG